MDTATHPTTVFDADVDRFVATPAVTKAPRVDWSDQAAEFLATSSKEAFLDWCWEHRVEIIGDRLRRAYEASLPVVERVNVFDKRVGALAECPAPVLRQARSLLERRIGRAQYRLGSATSVELLEAAAESRGTAEGLVNRADLFAAIARKLKSGERVEDRFSEDVLRAMADKAGVRF